MSSAETFEHEKEIREIIDETIKCVSKKIKEDDLIPEEYANTVNAFAALIEARQSRNQKRNQSS